MAMVRMKALFRVNFLAVSSLSSDFLVFWLNKLSSHFMFTSEDLRLLLLLSEPNCLLILGSTLQTNGLQHGNGN